MTFICDVQLDVTSVTCINVASQLARWGLAAELCEFAKQFQEAHRAQTLWQHGPLVALMNDWNRQLLQLDQVAFCCHVFALYLPLTCLSHAVYLPFELPSICLLPATTCPLAVSYLPGACLSIAFHLPCSCLLSAFHLLSTYPADSLLPFCLPFTTPLLKGNLLPTCFPRAF